MRIQCECSLLLISDRDTTQKFWPQLSAVCLSVRAKKVDYWADMQRSRSNKQVHTRPTELSSCKYCWSYTTASWVPCWDYWARLLSCYHCCCPGEIRLGLRRIFPGRTASLRWMWHRWWGWSRRWCSGSSTGRLHVLGIFGTEKQKLLTITHLGHEVLFEKLRESHTDRRAWIMI